MQGVKTRECKASTPDGNLFVKRWEPADDVTGKAPIVLFHDSLGCVALWRDFPERLALATGRGVIAYDRLGFGRSDPHPGRLEIDFVREEARTGFRYIKECLDIERFVAFGHSVGGGMAAAAAAEFPDACEALVTESAQAFVEERTIEGILAAREAFAEPGQLERLQRYHGDKATWVLGAWIDTWLSPAFSNWSLDETLHEVRCNALILHGDHDEYGSVRHPERIAALIEGNSSMNVLGCGHVPHRERAGEVLGLVTKWLAHSGMPSDS